MLDLRANRFVEIAIVLIVCAFLFFYGLGSFGLLGADEPRYAQIGAEMLARHDLIVPTLNGTPWLEKPALLYWAEMLSYTIFGVSDWAARVPVAAMTTAMVFAIYFFVRRFLAGWQLDAALIAASMAAMIGFGRAASTDMPLTACFTVAMLAWYAWYLDRRRRGWLLVFCASSALGMLAKGPVAPFLAGLTVVVFVAVNRAVSYRESAVRPETRFFDVVWRTLWWPGILLFLVIALPWYIAVQIKTGDFFRVFILEHNLARFGTNLYRHKQPFWYYVPVVLLGTMPWMAMFIASLVKRGVTIVSRDGGEAGGRTLKLFLLTWFVIPVVFFSLSQSKLPGYVLPSIPAAAILVVVYLAARDNGRVPTWMALLHALLCGAIVAGVVLSPHFLARVRPNSTAVAIAVVVGLAIFVMVAVAIIARGVRIAHAVTLIPVALCVGFIAKVAAPTLDATQSARPVANAISNLGYPDRSPVLVYQAKRETEYGLPFYRHSEAIHYDGGPLVSEPIMIVTREGSGAALGKSLPPGTAIGLIGAYAPQKLEFYIVSRKVH